MKKVWIVTGHSESGDDSGPERFDHKPTEEELKKFITNTGEELDCDGPGDFDSYVHLEIHEL
jgi:hypothetical protein